MSKENPVMFWIQESLGFSRARSLAAWGVAGGLAYYLWVLPAQRDAARRKASRKHHDELMIDQNAGSQRVAHAHFLLIVSWYSFLPCPNQCAYLCVGDHRGMEGEVQVRGHPSMVCSCLPWCEESSVLRADEHVWDIMTTSPIILPYFLHDSSIILSCTQS